MNILFISDNFPPERNASATRVYERAVYWARWGHKVTVITGAPNFPDGKVFDGYRNHWYRVSYENGIRVVRTKTFMAPNRGVVLRTADFLSFMVSSALAALCQSRPDVVVATSPQFFAAVAGSVVASARRLPFVFELSDLWPASISAVGAMRAGAALRFIERVELGLYRRATRIVALTQSFKDDLVRRGTPREKIAVIINGAELSRYSPRRRNARLARSLGIEKRFVVGYIGTHGMAHALERVLDAADLLHGHPSIAFLFVGSGAARESLLLEARRRKLSNVIFVSGRPKEEMPDYWSLCDLALVHLKRTPLFSMVIPSKIFEAMAMGVPILLAAPHGEASRIVNRNRAGEVVEAEDPEALAESVRRLCQNRERLKTLSANALAAAPAYTREKQAREMLDVLASAARAHPWSAQPSLESAAIEANRN